MQEMPSLIMSLSAKQEISQLLGENAAFGCFVLMPFYDIVFLQRRQQLPEFRRLFLQHCTPFD